jgi:hypothetical protein
VDVIDALVILQAAAGMISGVPCPRSADVDLDGDIDSIDGLLVLQRAADVLPSLPV